LNSTEQKRPAARAAAMVAALAGVGIVTYGLVSRGAEERSVREWTEAQAIPVVAVTHPSNGESSATLELPGRIEAYMRAPIYARVNGYLSRWTHDIGARVKAGELLAEIDTPDIDQQLAQARANLGVAQANAELARVSARRWQALAGTDAVSQQDVDTRVSTLDANLAQVKAAQAMVDGLVVQKSYARVIAPFDGVVTQRNTDVGALINAGSGNNGAALFELSDTSRVRIFVGVPQNFVTVVHPGVRVKLTVPEHPGTSVSGTIQASSQAVDEHSGTTLMQIIVDNREGAFLPGGYANAQLQLAQSSKTVSVPSSALIFNAKGLSVATVGSGNVVQIKPVSMARDNGRTVELAGGLSVDDRVITNPPDGVNDGVTVKVAEAAAAPPAAAKGAGAAQSAAGGAR
jgi:RND family efflux transporter MFP subunit